MKVTIHPHAIQFPDGSWMQKYDKRRKHVLNRRDAYLVKFKGSAEMMAEQMGGIPVEIGQPVLSGLPVAQTVGEWEDER
jgi:hypothetical protein